MLLFYSTGKFQPLHPFTWTITSNVRKPTHHAQRKEVDEGHASKGGGYAQQAPKVGQGAGGCGSLFQF